jgi:uncharacterized protein (DUF2336 family)
MMRNQWLCWDCGEYHYEGDAELIEFRRGEEYTPRQWYELSHSSDPEVRARLAKKNGAPEWVLQRLARDPQYIVRASVAGVSCLPEALVRLLAADPERRVRGNVAERSRPLPPDVNRQLADDSHYEVRAAIAARTDDAQVLVLLSEDENNYVRVVVAGNPATPPDVVRRLASDAHFWVRKTIAQREDLPRHLLELLARDPDGRVRKAIADRLDLPTDLSPEAFKGLMEIMDWRWKAAIAKREDLPPEMYGLLAGDRSVTVLRTLSRNPACPTEAAEVVARRLEAYARRRDRTPQGPEPEQQVVTDHLEMV